MDSGTSAAGANKSGSDSDSEVKFKDDELDNDSERSLDEDEALHGHDSEEIDSLQKESELPLEVLLQRYGYGQPAGSDEEPARATSSSAVRRKRVKRDVTSSTASTKRSKTDVSEAEAVGAVSTSNDDRAAETSTHRDTTASAPEVDAGAGAESDSLDGEEFTSESDSESDSEAEGEEDERYDVVGLLNDEPIGDDDDEDCAEYDPDADQSNIPYWKRDVRVGDEFQATLPDCSAADRPDASIKGEEPVTPSISASELESAKADRLDFRPKPVEESSIELYLVSFYKLLRRRRVLDEAGAAGGDSNGGGDASKHAGETEEGAFERYAATKDDEHALRTLFNCEFDADRALRVLEQELFPSENSSNREAASASACASVSTSTGDKPSEVVYERGDETFFFDAEECARFEAGLRYFGKDFFQIRRVYFSNEAAPSSTKDEQLPSASSDTGTQSAESHESGNGSGTGDHATERRAGGCTRSRSVRELVRFYYVWKKTERRDTFVQRYPFDKKRYAAVRPGVSDYLDRLFDEEPHEADADTGAYRELAEAPVEAERRQHAGANGVSNSQLREERVDTDDRSQRHVTSENLAD